MKSVVGYDEDGNKVVMVVDEKEEKEENGRERWRKDWSGGRRDFKDVSLRVKK